MADEWMESRYSTPLPASETRSSMRPAGKESVLVIDDEPQVLVALEDLLSDDFSVLTASSPEHAIRVAQETPALAVVLSDQRMPNITGDQLFAKLAACSAATRILITGFADVDAVIRAVNDGKIFAYLPKPWEPNSVRLTVQQGAEYFRLSRQLATERQLLVDLMNSTPDAIYFKDSDLRFVRVNRAFAELARPGSNEEDLRGLRLGDITGNEMLVTALECLERGVMASGGTLADHEQELRCPGRPRWLSVSESPIRDHDGSVVGLVGIARDITERKAQQERLERLSRMHAVLSGINSAVIHINDRKALLAEACRIAVCAGRLTMALVIDLRDERPSVTSCQGLDEALHRTLIAGFEGLQETDALRGWLPGVDPVVLNDLRVEDVPAPLNLLAPGQRALAIFPLTGGGRLESVFTLFAHQAGYFDAAQVELLNDLAKNLSFALDHMAQSERLTFLASFDELTGLPKRELLLDRTNQALVTRQAEGGKLAMVLIDLDRFRQVNETLGRRQGDHLLLLVAERLKESIAFDETLARIHGNCFALLSRVDGNEAELAARLQSRLLEKFSQAFVLGEAEIRISVRAGIAVSPSDGNDADTLLTNAEVALKKAKASNQAWLFYESTMNARVAGRLMLETRLRRALEQDEFVLHYQPKVDLKTSKVVGMEALIRWCDPETGLVPPARFIPVLEDMGLIMEVGHWVLLRAAAQYTQWVEQGLAPPRIAVNVSALQLAQADFSRRVEQVIEQYPLATSGVEFEITESVLMEDFSRNVEKLQAARALGFKVAIDDFGTGYSSLGYLSKLPIDAIKIDRSFILRMTDDPQETTIVMTILSLAHSLGLIVVAEGVETSSQARLLRLLRCDQIQGYLVAKPQPSEQMVALLGVTVDLGLG